MISLTENIPQTYLPRAEVIKINCNYNLYKDISLFWVQNNGQAVISMLDGNMTVYNGDSDIDELREFIKVISPLSVFSDAETLKSLFGNDFHRVCVMQSRSGFKSSAVSDVLNSREIYELLDTDGLHLPPYESFAVDFCYRLNHGYLKYFAKRGECAAVCITDGENLLLNGVASHKKGMGSAALKGVLSKFCNKSALAVCEPDVCKFYTSNNFEHIYDCGYRR